MSIMDPVHIMVMWYGAGFLPKLRSMKREELVKVLEQAGNCSERYPIHLIHKPTFECVAWSEEKLTGGQVVALMVFGLWVFLGEDEKLARPLLSGWPEIKDALILSPKEEKGVKHGS